MCCVAHGRGMSAGTYQCGFMLGPVGTWLLASKMKGEHPLAELT